MPSFGLRVSILLAAMLAAAVLAEAGAGSPTVPGCTAPAGGWKASSGAQVTPARESRLVVLVDRYRRQNGLHAVKRGNRLGTNVAGRKTLIPSARARHACLYPVDDVGQD